MPELAEVEWHRKQWNPGIGARVQVVFLHARKRVFRGTNTRDLARRITGQKLLDSQARGKRMLFRFTNSNWLGIHLGMTGSLRIEGPEYAPAKHDHLVLGQSSRSLVFRDARQFGRVQFHHGSSPPSWWRADVPEIVERDFNRPFFERFLSRHGKAPIKAVLLMQDGFSGIGNWMADEILWRSHILPAKRVAKLTSAERHSLFLETKFVARHSLSTLGHDDSDLPKSWLIHERWSKEGVCPKHCIPLRRATIGGRTTAWCPICQR